MSSLEIRIPDSIRSRVEDFARKEGVSVDDYVASVLSQRVALADVDSYVRIRAARGSADRLIELLDKAPAVESEPNDRITANG
jgi:uncharacterized protein (DUF1778 family)